MLLLYSGGLDTSVMLHWIQERTAPRSSRLTVDLGQPGEDWDVVVGKALKMGAIDAIRADAREEFARDYVLPSIKANALYGGGYPLFTALARPLIAKLAVEHARAHDCDTIAHGCTGKGNDQVRIEATIATLDTDLKIIAPVREWKMGREEEIAYARDNAIPIKGGTEVSPYSIDDNLWGRSSEGRADRGSERAAGRRHLSARNPSRACPDEPQLVRVGFEAGCPVSIDGERLELVDLIERAGEIGGRHGVGIVDHIEDRIVGLKVRDIYEVPAAAILLAAHRELEKLVSTIHQNNFKRTLEDRWAYLCYAGLWIEPLRHDLDAYMDSANEFVTGEATVKLYKGSATVVARHRPTRSTTRRSPHSENPAASSARRPAPASSSCSRSRAAWRTGCATATATTSATSPRSSARPSASCGRRSRRVGALSGDRALWLPSAPRRR